MNEKKIEKLMRTLDLTREEAIELIEEDSKVDKMSMKETNSDMSAEQQKAVKKYKNSCRAVNAYGKEVKRERKADEDKRKLIESLKNAVSALAADVEVTNIEREITLTFNNRKFKIVLSAPRK